MRDLTAVRALEAQLRHAQKMEAVGRLAGGVAHDFNNLLTVITGRSQLLLLKLPPESPLRRDVELVEETAHRASALTRQLLAFSRKQMVQPRVVDLNEVVRGMETMLSRLIGEDITLATRLDQTAGCVRADPAQLEQMIVNLAVNARDAMPLGGRLTLETSFVRLDEEFAREHVGLRPGPHVRLVVRDTGRRDGRAHQGAPLRALLHDQGPGQGTRDSAWRPSTGSSRRAAARSASTASPVRAPTFTIDLPRVDAPADLRGDPGIPAAAPHGSETVLLVEDEPEVRGLARDILHQQGYTVLEAADGDEALRVGREHGGPIHLLVTDVVMPQMGGRELADHLKAGRQRDQGALRVRLHGRRHPPPGRLGDRARPSCRSPSRPRRSPTRSGKSSTRPRPAAAAKPLARPGRGAVRPARPRRAARGRSTDQSARTAIADSNARIVSATSASSWTMDR